jgi:hypothetical protein
LRTDLYFKKSMTIEYFSRPGPNVPYMYLLSILCHIDLVKINVCLSVKVNPVKVNPVKVNPVKVNPVKVNPVKVTLHNISHKLWARQAFHREITFETELNYILLLPALSY